MVHPTIKQWRERDAAETEAAPTSLGAEWLRQLVLAAGADDVGFVQIERPELDDQRDDILAAFPGTKTLISYVVRMNREPIRTPARSVANLEFHHTGDVVNDIGRKVVRALEDQGIRALNPSMGFPDGDGPVSRQALGGQSQTGRRGGRTWHDGHSSQRHPSEVRQLHPAGNHSA